MLQMGRSMVIKDTFGKNHLHASDLLRAARFLFVVISSRYRALL